MTCAIIGAFFIFHTSSLLYIQPNGQKIKVFRRLVGCFSPTLSFLLRLSGSYGGAFLNHAAKIVIKPTFCWTKITNNLFCQVGVAK